MTFKYFLGNTTGLAGSSVVAIFVVSIALVFFAMPAKARPMPQLDRPSSASYDATLLDRGRGGDAHHQPSDSGLGIINPPWKKSRVVDGYGKD